MEPSLLYSLRQPALQQLLYEITSTPSHPTASTLPRSLGSTSFSPMPSDLAAIHLTAGSISLTPVNSFVNWNTPTSPPSVTLSPSSQKCTSPYLLTICNVIVVFTRVFLPRTDVDENCDLPEIVRNFSAANPSAGECLTVEQTGVVLSALAAQVDQIFDTAAEVLSLPALIDFLYYLLQASSAELTARSHPQSTPVENKMSSNLKQAVNSVKDELVKVAKLGMASSNGNSVSFEHCDPHKPQSPALFLDR